MDRPVEEYPDLDFGVDDIQEDYDTAMTKKRFVMPIGSDEIGVGRSQNFVSSPTVVHFGGFTTHEEVSQEISVVNISSHSQRISILPPTTEAYTVSYFLQTKFSFSILRRFHYQNAEFSHLECHRK